MTETESLAYPGRRLARPGEDIFDQGLTFDLQTHLGRRGLLRIAGVSAVGMALAGCGLGGGGGYGAAGTNAGVDGSGAAACDPIPAETAGPYPADGSNGPDVLTETGIVRRDIRSSFDGLSGTAVGIPLTIELALQEAGSCTPLPGAAVYVWHCDRDAEYSLYTITDQNYLRGVQAGDAEGIVRFTSIFPGCYSGRWPHIHFEVFPDVDAAAAGTEVLAISQIALPQETCEQVYATEGYEQSIANLRQVSLQTDNVFGEDGGERQLGTVAGSLQEGFTVGLSVPVATA